MDTFYEIKSAIEEKVKQGNRDFIIYPYGRAGMQTKEILNNCFGIQEAYIIDNKLSTYNNQIFPISILKQVDCTKFFILFACMDPELYNRLNNELSAYVPHNNIVDIFQNLRDKPFAKTMAGKYSYGPLCDHWLVEKIGAFCSTAYGADVVENHPVQYISTHPFMYAGGTNDEWKYLNNNPAEPWFFPGITPHGFHYKRKRIIIGNDVWIGRNVLITNGSNIGNGVIAAAGAVITKDVPDYAVVAGVPARIIRFRYSSEQIKELNKIAWWEWPDDKIRYYYEDFYEDIDVFISRHSKL